MKNLNILFTISLFVITNLSFTQTNLNQEKIGIIFKTEGPFKIYRNGPMNINFNQENDSEENKYFDAINFLKNEKANPTVRLKEFYINQLKSSGFEFVIIPEELNEQNFPLLNSKKNRFFRLNVSTLKNKYNINKVLIVNIQFGFEFEHVGVLGGDKRTSISINNFVVDINNNEIYRKFTVENIKNIKKKDLINPPDYPNIVESMDRLLNERIYPEITKKIESLND